MEKTKWRKNVSSDRGYPIKMSLEERQAIEILNLKDDLKKLTSDNRGLNKALERERIKFDILKDSINEEGSGARRFVQTRVGRFFYNLFIKYEERNA